MPEINNPWLPLVHDTAIWQNLSLAENTRREIITRLAAGEIAIPLTAQAGGAFASRTLNGVDHLIPLRFLAMVDFFLSRQTLLTSTTSTQAAALAAMLQGENLIVTGGPGTGKSHLIAEFIAQKQSAATSTPLRITIAAPTGKAAARFQHLNIETQTIHRFLGMGASGKPIYHAAAPAPYDIVIVDEISMVDQGLFAALVTALPGHAQLILAGDLNQLPAVGGRPVEATIRFLLEQNLIAGATLTETYRFSRAKAEAYAAIAVSGLTELSEGVEGLKVLPIRKPGEFSAFLQDYTTKFFCSEAIFTLRASLARLPLNDARQQKILSAAFEHLKQSMLLTQLREGWHGSREVARRIEHLVRIASPPDAIPLTPIIATANNYALSIFNGDTGFLLEHNGVKTAVFEVVGGGFRFLSLPRLQGYESAYALTIHKSQGSEYENVFILHSPDVSGTEPDHRLLYTAVTRARKSATIIVF